METALKQAAELIGASRKLVALTGAGVSTESGIPDFRSKGGLWSRFDIMEYGTLGAFRRNPTKVWQMLAELMEVTSARPNKGHLALAELERCGLLAGIITQNIDGLHQQAGSKEVVEFHGSLATFSCLHCQNQYERVEVELLNLPPACPHCQALLKPDVVFFDEQIPAQALQASADLLHGCDLLLVAGTSCQVVPAAYIPGQVRQQGGQLIEINLEPALGQQATVVLVGSFSKTLQQLALLLTTTS